MNISIESIEQGLTDLPFLKNGATEPLIIALEADLEQLKGFINSNDAPRAAAVALRAGATWAELVHKSKGARGGRHKDPVHKFLLVVNSEHPNEKQDWIVTEALRRCKVARKRCRVTKAYLLKNFTQLIRIK